MFVVMKTALVFDLQTPSKVIVAQCCLGQLWETIAQKKTLKVFRTSNYNNDNRPTVL